MTLGGPRRAGAASGMSGLTRVLALLAAALLAALVLTIMADVVARMLFDQPLRGVTEFASLAVPALTFLAAPWLAGSDGLIRAGLLSRWLEGGGRHFRAGFDLSFSTIALLLSAAIAAATAPWLLRAWRDGEFVGVEGDFTAPLWPARLTVLLGAALLAVCSGRDLLRALSAAGTTGVRRTWLPLLLFVLPFTFLAPTTHAGVGALAIVTLFVLLYAGLPVVFALLAAAALGIGFIRGDAGVAVGALGLAATGAVSSYVFAAVPLFVFMGLVVGRADIGRDSLLAAHWLLARVVGGLAVATVLANALFAAITGISIASAAIFSKVAVPPLVEHGHTARFAAGLVAGSSVLGMLIPPSLLLIVYGLVAEVSINALFLAAILPGLILTALFALASVVAVALRLPFAITDGATGQRGPGLDARAAATRALPVVILIGAVLGGIYGGVFTPTEAGAVGAMLALALGLAMRRLSLRTLGAALFDASASAASILLLIVAASAFGMMLTLSGIPDAMGQLAGAAGVGLTGYVLGYVALLIVLGMVLDSTSILLIMVPLALPTVKALGGDLVWFGVVTVIGVEIGLLTPPLGLSVFAIKSSLDDQRISINEIFIGALPFALLMLALTVFLVLFPALARVPF